MSQMLIFKLSPEARQALNMHARKLHRSSESVAREILEVSLVPENRKGLGERLAAIWKGGDHSYIEFERDKSPHEPIDL